MSSSTSFHRWTWWVHLMEGRLLSACRELKCSVGTEPVRTLTVSFYNQHTLFVLLLPCFHVNLLSRWNLFRLTVVVCLRRWRLRGVSGRSAGFIFSDVTECDWKSSSVPAAERSSCLSHQINQRCTDRLMTSSQQTAGNSRRSDHEWDAARRRQKNYRWDQTMEDLMFYISQINIWCCLSLSWMMMIKSSWIFLSFFLKLNKEVKLLLSCYLL